MSTIRINFANILVYGITGFLFLCFAVGDSFEYNKMDEAIMEKFGITPHCENDKEVSNLPPNTNTTAEGRLSRKKRWATIAWPPNTNVILQFNIEVPLYTPKGLSIPLAFKVPYIFKLPNTSFPTSSQARNSELGRRSIFGMAESLFSRFGIDGKACILQSICERSDGRQKPDGLIGEVLDLILTLSGGSEWLGKTNYIEAEKGGGAEGGDCSSKYSSCPFSLLALFDTLIPKRKTSTIGHRDLFTSQKYKF